MNYVKIIADKALYILGVVLALVAALSVAAMLVAAAIWTLRTALS